MRKYKENVPIDCALCGRTCKGWIGLGRHMEAHKDYTLKSYYDEFLKLKPNECLQCGKETIFLDLSRGYKNYCNASCQTKHTMAKAKAKDPEKFALRFKENGRMHSERWQEPERREKWIENIGIASRAAKARMTPEERKYKWRGYVNLSDEERKEKQREHFNRTLKPFYEDISEEEFYKITLKIHEVKVSKGIETPRSSRSEWEGYSRLVNMLTERTYLKYYHLINPNNIERGIDFPLDHKYSKFAGFRDRIPAEIISSWINLEILTLHENSSKRANCSISKDELISKYNEFYGKEKMFPDIDRSDELFFNFD